MAQEAAQVKISPPTIPALGPKTGLLLALLLTAFAIAPLTYPGYFQVHSGFLPVYGLQDASPPPFSLTGDGPLPHYLALALRFLGLRPVEAVKGVLALAFVAGALGMYGWARRWAGEEGALLAATIYTYLPYRLALAFVRGAWGEALATGLAPAALWSLEGLAFSGRKPRPLYLAGVLLTWGGLVLSQAGMALWLLLLAMAYLLIVGRRLRWLPVGLAAWGGLTALALRLWYAPTGVSFSEHFLYPFQLTSAYWGHGASLPGWADGMSFQVGLAALGLALMALFLLPGESDRPAWLRGRLFVFCGGALATVALLSPVSAPLWQLSGLEGLLSYPWQLLAWVGLCLTAAAGIAPALDGKLRTLPVQGVLLGLTILASYPYLEPRFTQVEPGRAPLATLGGGQITLLSYTLAVEVSPHDAPQQEGGPYLVAIPGPQYLKPGQKAHLTLRWQASRPLEKSYTLFVHLLDGSDHLQAQNDGQPCRGECPTTGWSPGEIIEDEQVIDIPAGAASPPYRLAVGMYLPESGERLPVAGNGDGRVIIGE